MKKFIKILPMMVVVLALLVSSCSGDQETTRTTDANEKSKVPVIGNDWKEIGYIKDGTIVLTIDKEKALARLSANMKKYAGIDEVYTDMYVVNFEDDYNLLFEGKNYRSTFYVAAISSKVSSTVDATLVAGPRITCTTSDCSSEPTGCAVKYDNDDTGLPYCSPCSNGGKCTKTAISSDVALF
ncbi:hypothetical protein [Kordia zhangzhouensis]|uniref:hypothetical protein n=1 Tax=Kordia zhangzhouensis TaxID=1620405 RepID=UPI00062923DA|nr:hypothetical protein [Kordia zhangzhouensis]